MPRGFVDAKSWVPIAFSFVMIASYYVLDYDSLVANLALSDSMTHGEDDGQYNGRYPNSLLTLFYPYTLLRDVVLDQPVDESDVPFFWHIHKSDEKIVKRILTKCYGLDLIELDTMESIEKAKEVNLASAKPNKNRVITSPHIREAIQIFNTDNFGRMICFFRHPADYDLHSSLPTFPKSDNWLTRYLSDEHEGPIEFKQLGVAKHVVRETCVVATIDKMEASIKRQADYFGWKLKDGGQSCIDDALRDNPKETWVDHESDAWTKFYKLNKYDCQLYEIAQSTWRAQIQTIIPLETQLSRAAPDKDEEEGEDEEK